MTARTHDLAAFTALNFVVINLGIPSISFATAVTGLGMCFMGGLAPDLDNSTSEFWKKIPAGSILGKLIDPLFSHRHISHSVLGVLLFGSILKYLLNLASAVVLVDMNIVLFAFLIGYTSHLLMDTLTTEGVPWLFPLPFHLGLPPYREYRVKTGNSVEKFVVFPLLIIVNIYLFQNNYQIYTSFIKNVVK